MARYLVVAHQTAGSPELRFHVKKLAAQDPAAEFTVLVPATPGAHLFTWTQEETTAVARRNMESSARLLQEAGANVSRRVIGARAPLDAIRDELREGPRYDELIVCTFPPGVSRWLRLDLINQARKASGLPVTHVTARPYSRREVPPPAVAAEPSPVESAPAPAGDGGEPAPAGKGSDAGDGARPRTETSVREEDVGRLQLPYIEREDLPEEARELWDRLVEGQDVANIFRVMGHNRPLLQGYVELLNALWNESGLDDQTRELVILRTALLQRSRYVWDHHVRIARELGVSDDVLLMLEHWQSSELVHFDERQRLVLGYVDAVARDKPPSSRLHEGLARYYPVEAIIGLTLLIGFYRMTGSFATALEMEPEGRFVGWQLMN